MIFFDSGISGFVTALPQTRRDIEVLERMFPHHRPCTGVTFHYELNEARLTAALQEAPR